MKFLVESLSYHAILNEILRPLMVVKFLPLLQFNMSAFRKQFLVWISFHKPKVEWGKLLFLSLLLCNR